MTNLLQFRRVAKGSCEGGIFLLIIWLIRDFSEQPNLKVILVSICRWLQSRVFNIVFLNIRANCLKRTRENDIVDIEDCGGVF